MSPPRSASTSRACLRSDPRAASGWHDLAQGRHLVDRTLAAERTNIYEHFDPSRRAWPLMAHLVLPRPAMFRCPFLPRSAPSMLLCKVFRNVSLALSLGTAVACGGAEQRPEGAPLEGPAVLVSYAAADFADIPAFFEDDGDRLIWLTRAGALHRIAKDGTGSVRVALDPRRPRALSVTETHAYWAVDSSSAEHLPGGLLRAPKQGGSVEPIVTGDILDFAVDSSGVYWTERGASDQRVIRALGHDDKQPRTLANDRQAGAIAVDAANVYFSASESDFSTSARRDS